nr:MAG: major capsid protein [Microviridae sp.]
MRKVYFAKDKLKPNVPYSKFDLSHIRSMDIDFGILYPFWIEDCLPGDRFKISNVLKLQALPLKNPLFNNIKLYTYYFYVPYYLLWHKFDRFISGGRDGTYSASLPVIRLNSNNLSIPDSLGATDRDTIFGCNTLWDYLGFEPIQPVLDNSGSTVTFHSFDVSAFPFAAYQRIFRDYFLNQDVQTSTNINKWFPEDDFDFALHDGVNAVLGESSLTPDSAGDYNYSLSALDPNSSKPCLLALRARNFNKDYFTSSMFSPQRGPLQALGSNSSLVSQLVADDGFTFPNSNILRVINVGSVHQFGFVDSNNETYGKSTLSQQLSWLMSTGNFTISDLHLAQQIELWMERNMQVKARYNEFLRIHFNDAPLDERLTKPFYIGGTVQDVMISNVLQTSQTTSSSAQGTLTGNASSFDSDYVGTFHSHEYGLIMGICCIMPEAYYEHGIDRHWTKKSRFDFYFPEFCDLEPQAILRKEFDARDSGSSIWLDEPLSYIGRYDEYRHHRSMAVGSLRNPSATDFKSWIMPRVNPFEYAPYNIGLPILSSSLICTHRHFAAFSSPSKVYDSYLQDYRYQSLISHDAWDSGYTVNPFLLQIGISCTAVRPLPYVPDPSRNSY